MEIYKPAMFLQTNNIFSNTSPTSQFISRFNWKAWGLEKLKVFDVLSPPAQEPCSSCSFVTRSLSMLFMFLGSNPFSAAVFRSALPVLFPEYPADKTGSEGEVWLHFKIPWITHLLNPLLTVLLSFLFIIPCPSFRSELLPLLFVFYLLQLFESATVLFQQLQRQH